MDLNFPMDGRVFTPLIQRAVVAEPAPANSFYNNESELVAVVGKSAKKVITNFMELDETGRDRYYDLVSHYSSETAFAILSNLEQYKLNTWKNVCDKIDFIAQGKHNTPYHESIMREIQLDRFYTIEEIIHFVSSLRRSLGEPLYRSQNAKLCAKDFLQMHIGVVKMTEYNDIRTDKPFVAGYTPVLNLNSQI